MSANVWFEEVNTGLLNELKSTIRVKDANGVLVALKDKSFVIRKPEEDFKIEVYPCVSIYNISNHHSPIRYNPAPVKVGEDKENNIVILEDPAVPFDLEVQIDFWTKYQEDRDCMLKTWLPKHFRQFNLKVVDDGGVERSCNCLVKGKVVNSDLVLKGERLFHSLTKLQIWVELDNETRYNNPMVVSIGVNTQEN